MFAKKKRIDIYGTLEFPLAIGCAAFIKKQEGDPIRTSSVKHFITLPSGVTYIQTKNTHYYLHPPAKAAAIKGVRVLDHRKKPKKNVLSDWQRRGSIRSFP